MTPAYPLQQILWLRLLLATLPLALLWPGLRQVLDARMAYLMLLEFPALAACGWAAAARLPSRTQRWLGSANTMGLLSYTVFLAVFSYWMIPSALDEALLSPTAYAARHLTWLAAGAVWAIPRPRVHTGVDLFFLGNVAWMAGSAGLLYREGEDRLCVNYLLQDQLAAGSGLLVLAVMAVAWASWMAVADRS